MTEADTEAEMDFLIEWAIHMEVCVACRGFYAHLKQKRTWINPRSRQRNRADPGCTYPYSLR